jgi:ParB family chromosome partitioning protein
MAKEGLAAEMLPLATLAPHPANPRGDDLGDLTTLAASIGEVGLLEPVVAVTVAAHLAGGWPAVACGATHVVLAGHRRRAAALARGLAEVPGLVRDDLAGDDAMTVMLTENDPDKRRPLSPLAEARAFAVLDDRGWTQRRIAERMACGQSHVSKRLALLRLPQEAIAALAAEQITLAAAGELGRLEAHPDRAVRALRQIISTRWDSATRVVNWHLDQLRVEENVASACARLRAERVRIVNPGLLGAHSSAKRLDPGPALEPHRAAGCLVGAANQESGDPVYYCRDPDSHEGTPAAVPGWKRARDGQDPARVAEDRKRAAEDRDRADAARARRQAAARLAAYPISIKQAAQVVSIALIYRGVDAACLKTAMGWLREAGIGPADGDAYSYANHVIGSGDPGAVRRLGAAMALAADEQATGAIGNGEWAERQIAYLDRLITEAGYQPTRWEQGRLERARSRVHARATLSCGDCGCTYTKQCPGSTSRRCDVEPTKDGGWRYECNAKHTSASPSAPPGGRRTADCGAAA